MKGFKYLFYNYYFQLYSVADIPDIGDKPFPS